MKAKYIGPEYEFNNVSLIKDQEYDINIEQTGPQMIVNGQPVVLGDSTLIVHVGNVAIPYAPNLIENAWQIIS